MLLTTIAGKDEATKALADLKKEFPDKADKFELVNHDTRFQINFNAPIGGQEKERMKRVARGTMGGGGRPKETKKGISPLPKTVA